MGVSTTQNSNRSPAPRVRALGLASHWPFEQWGRFLPEHVIATSLLDRLLYHATVVVTEGESFRLREARTRAGKSRS
jgi:DNA replication protein DnaC